MISSNSNPAVPGTVCQSSWTCISCLVNNECVSTNYGVDYEKGKTLEGKNWMQILSRLLFGFILLYIVLV